MAGQSLELLRTISDFIDFPDKYCFLTIRTCRYIEHSRCPIKKGFFIVKHVVNVDLLRHLHLGYFLSFLLPARVRTYLTILCTTKYLRWMSFTLQHIRIKVPLISSESERIRSLFPLTVMLFRVEEEVISRNAISEKAPFYLWHHRKEFSFLNVY